MPYSYNLISGQTSGYSVILNGSGCSISYSSLYSNFTYNLSGIGSTATILNGSGSSINSITEKNMNELLSSSGAHFNGVKNLKQQREEIIKNWDENGLLGSGHVSLDNLKKLAEFKKDLNLSENPKQYIAKTSLLNSGDLGITNLKGLTEQRKNIIKQWDESGLLEGLDMSKKSNIAQLLECQASFLLDENEARPMKRIRLRFNHKFKNNNELWKLYIDNETYIVSQVIFMCPVETTLDFDKETNDYKAHISCDANSIDVDHTSDPGRIIVTVKNN